MYLRTIYGRGGSNVYLRTIYVLSKKVIKNIAIENFHFLHLKKYLLIAWACFPDDRKLTTEGFLFIPALHKPITRAMM